MPGDWRLWASSTCKSRAIGTIEGDCSRVARATTPGSPPQPHGWARLGLEVSRFPHGVGGQGMCPGSPGCGVSGPFCSTSSNKKKASLPVREASLIKKEYCRCGPHPPQVTSSRARPPLVKEAGHIGPLLPELRGWPLLLMASIALWGPHQLALDVVPGASLYLEALTPECRRECLGTGDCGPARHVGAGRWGRLTAHGLLGPRHPGPQPHGWVRLGLEVSRFPHFWSGGQGMCPGSLGCGVSGLFSSFFSPHP